MLLVAATLAATVASGCGDEDDGGSPSASSDSSLTTSSLSKAEYLKKAGAACQRERADLLGEFNSYVKKHDSKGVEEGVLLAKAVKTVLLPTIDDEIAAVRELGAPEGDEEELEAILTTQEEAVDKAKGLKGAKTLEEFEDPFLEATKMYRDYGFTACTNSI